jgi:hypothetical protein
MNSKNSPLRTTRNYFITKVEVILIFTTFRDILSSKTPIDTFYERFYAFLMTLHLFILNESASKKGHKIH